MLFAVRGFGLDPQRFQRGNEKHLSRCCRACGQSHMPGEQFKAIRADLDATLEKLKACSNPIDRRNLLTALRRLLAELDKLTKEEIAL
jgi:hypothetical protein